MTKHCEDCIYYQNDGYKGAMSTPDESHCIHQRSIYPFDRLPHVTRLALPTYSMTCHDMRDNNLLCGPSAELFEPKVRK